MLRRTVRALQILDRRRAGGVTILAYHLVGAGTSSPVDLPLPLFRRQMEELAVRGGTVHLGDAMAELLAGACDHRVVLTFDDAYENFHRNALPVLRELGLPATLFVPTGFVSGHAAGPIDGARKLRPCSWRQLREMAVGTLVRLGSHGQTHRDLPALADAELACELEDSKRELEERTGREVEAFCYPRGRWSERTARRVARTYRFGLIGGGRKNLPVKSRSCLLQRVPIRRDGPPSLAPILEASVWIEEWIASRLRSRLR